MAAIGSFWTAFCPRMGLTLLHSLWQGALVAGVLAVFLWWLRSRPVQARYAACLAALLTLAACLPATFVLVAPAGDGASTVSSAAGAPELGVGNVSVGAVNGSDRKVGAPRSAPNHRIDLLAASDFVRSLSAHCVGGWLLGVVLLSTRLACGVFGLRYWMRGREPVSDDCAALAIQLARRMGLGRVPQVFASQRTAEALVVGLWRPVVLLPASWLAGTTPELLEAVLAHELAHIRRWDLWAIAVQRVVEAVMFYHPAVWWISRQVSQQREMCSDAMAAAATGKRVEYVRALAEVARWRQQSPRCRPAAAASIGGRKMALLERVRYVLGLAAPPARTSTGCTLLGMAVVLPALTAVAMGIALTLAFCRPASADSTSFLDTLPGPGEEQKSLEECTKAIEANPQDADAYRCRGDAYHHRGEFDLALADYNEAIRLDPKNAKAYYGRGCAYLRKKKFDQTVADCSEALRLEPKLVAALINRAYAYNKQRKSRQQLADCNEALRLEPKSVAALIIRAHAYNNQGKSRQALADCDEAIRLDAKSAYAYGIRAGAQLNLGEFDKALADADEALRLDASMALAHYIRATIYYRTHAPDKALAEYHETLRLDPKRADAMNNLGVLLWEQGKRDEATQQWRKATELDPTYDPDAYADAHSNLGFALKEQGNLSDAEAHFKKAIELNPDLAKAYNNLGLVRLKQDDPSEAESLFLEAIRRRPDELVAHENLARLYWQQAQKAGEEADKLFATDAKAAELKNKEKNKKYDMAADQLKEMLKIKPDNPVAINSMVMVLLNAEKIDEAIEFCRQALQRNPDNFDARHNLGVALLRQHKTREGMDAWREVLKQKPDAMPTLGQLAWVLATCPDASLRNGTEALKLAEQAVQATVRKDPGTLDALAAAYAEVGEFDKAVKMAEEAAAAASEKNDKRIEDVIRARIETYRSGSAYRDGSLAPAESTKAR